METNNEKDNVLKLLQPGAKIKFFKSGGNYGYAGRDNEPNLQSLCVNVTYIILNQEPSTSKKYNRLNYRAESLDKSHKILFAAYENHCTYHEYFEIIEEAKKEFNQSYPIF